MSTYRLFGLTLRSHLPLALPEACGCVPDVRIVPWRGPDSALRAKTPALDSIADTYGGPTTYQLFCQPHEDVLRVGAVADFSIRRRVIGCSTGPAADPGRVQRCLLTTVIALWLERRGWPVLHGAAIEVDDGAVLLLASGYTGKSTLAARLVRAGFRILTDDLVAVEKRQDGFFVKSSYPSIGLWPGPNLGSSFQALPLAPRVHPSVDKRSMRLEPSAFCSHARRIDAVYTLHRDCSGSTDFPIRFEGLSPGAGAIECVRHSFVPRTVEAGGLQQERLALIASLTSAMPVVRVHYPSGFDYLGLVCDRIVEHTRVTRRVHSPGVH